MNKYVTLSTLDDELLTPLFAADILVIERRDCSGKQRRGWSKRREVE